MKNFNFVLLLSIFLALVCYSCTGGDSVAYHYQFVWRFEDGAAKDKVKGIDRWEKISDNPIKDSLILVNTAEYELFLDGSDEPIDNIYVYIKPEYECLTATTYLHGPKQMPTTLTHRFKCSHIFGDDKEHTIVTQWDEKRSNICLSGTIDGKEFSVTEAKSGKYSIALITTDN